MAPEHLPEELDHKPTMDELALMRHRIIEDIGKWVAKGYHLYDAADKAGMPRAIVIANLSNPEIRKWWELSRDRKIIRMPDWTPGVEDIRVHSVRALDACGLKDKLAVMTSLADPTTEEGQETLLKLAALQVKYMPKQVHQKTEKVDTVDPSEALAELQRLREERQEAQDLQDRANDANFEGLDE